MEHNRTKAKGETVSIFAYSLDLGTFSMYKITENVAIDITPLEVSIESIGNDIYKTTVTLPNEDCIVCTLLNEQAMFLRVGEPEIRYCLYTGKVNSTIPYQRLQEDGSYISSGNLVEYGYGIYGFKPSTLEYGIIECAGEKVALDVPYGSMYINNSTSGVIRLESDRFEMISMPVKGRTVNDYFIAKIEEVTGKAAIESIDFVKAYPSNTTSSGKYIGFVPGVTNPDSSYNFKLVEDDGGQDAHVPFFVRTKILDNPIEISWTTEDEVV